MRVIQLIDSLETGGAEKMAVNYANALSRAIGFSGLVATRKEGNLKEQLENEVHYLFLGRNRTVDFGALMRLRSFCKSNQIEWIHAHSSSVFIAVALKLSLPGIKVIWHDHSGWSEFLRNRKSTSFKIASFFFTGIIAVNQQLKNWALSTLNCRNVIYLPNFTDIGTPAQESTKLEGAAENRILCLANLRGQKNHPMLIEIAAMMKITHPQWTFHLVGKDFENAYSANLRQSIIDKGLEKHVFIYGTRSDSSNIIDQCDIAILTSRSEGLPVSLLEYGAQAKAVVCTAVGEIPLIIADGRNGFTVPAGDAGAFFKKLQLLADDPERRVSMGKALKETVKDYSEDQVIAKYLSWLQSPSQYAKEDVGS